MLPRSPTSAARISVETETEVAGGWLFHVRVTPPAGESGGGGGGSGGGGESGGSGASGLAASEHDVRLSWPDYEYWGHGSICPSRIAETVLIALVEARPELSLPASFDASTARRWARDLDERVRELV